MGVPSPRRHLPRLLGFLAVPVVGLILTLFFIYLGFPYDLLAERVSRLAEQSGGVTLRIGELSPHIALAGPGFKAAHVETTVPGGAELRIDEIVARPAWSLSWLRGVPAVYLDAKSPLCKLAGTVTLGDTPGFRGRLRELELAEVPAGGTLTALSLRGQLDAEIDLQRIPGGETGNLAGSIEFAARKGAMSTEAMPLEIPYDLMSGTITLGGEHFAYIDSLRLEGPMVSAEARGSIGQGRTLQRRPLDLELSYEIQAADIKSMLRAVGVRVGPGGAGKLQIRGTLGRPRTMTR